jgi:hypothetical protein
MVAAHTFRQLEFQHMRTMQKMLGRAMLVDGIIRIAVWRGGLASIAVPSTTLSWCWHASDEM